MLIRWATYDDLPVWRALESEVAPIFIIPCKTDANSAMEMIKNHEILTAVDYMSGDCMGIIGISRPKNQITWFAVFEKYQRRGAGERLLKTALRQLDTNKDIFVNTFQSGYSPGVPAQTLYRKYGFTQEKPHEYQSMPPTCRLTRPADTEKRGGSFHYRYPNFIRLAQEEFCPVCNDEPAPDDQIDIACLENCWVCGEYPGQGRLFGKMYAMPRKHAFHFEDMPETDAAAFMNEVQRVGRALRKVTGAVKINYEMHSNSGAHLHIHLFPRYLDDDFPSAPIDYRVTEPYPYESYDEYLWFVEQMRHELKIEEAHHAL
ncbi:MAG: GNAT family N-acetyltransferase [Oscillospiraceae bacterium]|nr:GNAT family N-acetyltransferase [Oscillospiraceae bacterium]